MTIYYCGKHTKTVVEALDNSYYCPECGTTPGTIKPEQKPTGFLQIYPFHSDDVQTVYEKLNSFLKQLATLNVSVPLEQVRAVTKHYPDYGTTATTIEVAVYIGGPAPHETASVIRDLHRAVLRPSPEAKPEAVKDDFDPFLDSDELP